MRYNSLPPWSRLAISHKTRWMNAGDDQDSPPALVAEWDDHPAALIVCLGDDNVVGKAIVFIRAGMDPDAIVMIHDTYLAVRENGQFAEELTEALGSGRVTLAQMAEEGGLERGTVIEAMASIRQTRDGQQEFIGVPYQLRDNLICVQDSQIEHMKNPTGRKPELLAECIKMGEGVIPDSIDVVAGMLDVSRDRARILGAKATLQILQREGYIVLPIHPGLGDLADYRPGSKTRRPDPEFLKKKRRAR